MRAAKDEKIIIFDQFVIFFQTVDWAFGNFAVCYRAIKKLYFYVH